MFRFCGIDPVTFWKYTPAETELMITVAADKYNTEMEFEMSLNSRLCAVTMNANGATKKDKKPFDVEDFMPNKQSQKQSLTAEQYEMIVKAKVIQMGGIINET